MRANFDLKAFQEGLTRRTFLGRAAFGLGGLALASLLDPALLRGESVPQHGRWRGVINPPNFPIRAKRIIHLYMAGGP
ncbi:MAG TPA: sulfatase, partial [Verrucomicrobiae bacterium]|nr:sulfatase [Verrucomicrobiae bacterium]